MPLSLSYSRPSHFPPPPQTPDPYWVAPSAPRETTLMLDDTFAGCGSDQFCGQKCDYAWLALKANFARTKYRPKRKTPTVKFHSSGFCCSTNIMLLGEMLTREFEFKLIQEMLLSWNWVLDSPNWKFRVLQLPTVWLIEIVQMLSVCSCTRCTVQGVHLTNYCVM